MLVTGIIVTIVALGMSIFPHFFARLKSPRISEKLLKSEKIITILRIWGLLFVGVGIALIVISLK